MSKKKNSETQRIFIKKQPEEVVPPPKPKTFINADGSIILTGKDEKTGLTTSLAFSAVERKVAEGLFLGLCDKIHPWWKYYERRYDPESNTVVKVSLISVTFGDKMVRIEPCVLWKRLLEIQSEIKYEVNGDGVVTFTNIGKLY